MEAFKNRYIRNLVLLLISTLIFIIAALRIISSSTQSATLGSVNALSENLTPSGPSDNVETQSMKAARLYGKFFNEIKNANLEKAIYTYEEFVDVVGPEKDYIFAVTLIFNLRDVLRVCPADNPEGLRYRSFLRLCVHAIIHHVWSLKPKINSIQASSSIPTAKSSDTELDPDTILK